MERKRIALGVRKSIVLEVLGGKKSTSQAAAELGVSQKTVREWVRIWKTSAQMRALGAESPDPHESKGVAPARVPPQARPAPAAPAPKAAAPAKPAATPQSGDGFTFFSSK